MNIILAINDSYVEPAIILLCSIFYNNKNAIRVFFLDSSLSVESKNRLRRYIEENNQEVYFVSVDESIFKNAPEREGLSIETYFRLLAPWILDGVDRVLYLDADMVVNGNIEDIFEMDMGEYYIAGVVDQGTAPTDLYHRAEIGLRKNSPYVNGGMLLMDLKRIRTNCSEDEIWTIINTKGAKLIYQDQDIINVMFEGKICVLSELFNYVPIFENVEDFWNYVLLKGKKPVIIHYFAETKPWYKNYGFKFLKIYSKYCNMTDCQNIKEEVRRNLRYYYKNLRKQLKYIYLRKNYNKELVHERDMNLYWLQHSGTYVEYLKALGYEKVAVYGIGRIGKVLIEELQSIVVCVIDKYSNERIEGHSVIRPKDYDDSADIVIVTVWNKYDEIYNDIKQDIMCPIVSVEDLIYKFL